MLLRHAAGALQVQRPTQCPCNTNVTCARWRSRRQQPQHLQQVHLGQRPATCAAAVQDEAGVSYDWSWSPGKSSLPEQSPFDAQHAIPEQLTLQDLLALLSAAAADDDSSEPPSEAWVQQLTARAAPLLQQLQAPQACQVVQQLSQLDYTPGEQWMGAVMQQLCSQLQGLTPQQLSGLMWSLSNLRYTPVQQHWAALLSAGQSCLQDFYGPDLAYFLCAAGSIYANNNSSFDLETGARQQPGEATDIDAGSGDAGTWLLNYGAAVSDAQQLAQAAARPPTAAGAATQIRLTLPDGWQAAVAEEAEYQVTEFVGDLGAFDLARLAAGLADLGVTPSSSLQERLLKAVYMRTRTMEEKGAVDFALAKLDAKGKRSMHYDPRWTHEELKWLPRRERDKRRILSEGWYRTQWGGWKSG